MKPSKPRKWADIKDVRDALPEGVSFGSLTVGGVHEFGLDLGASISLSEIDQIREEVDEALTDIGVPTDRYFLRAGYSGTTSPTIHLVVRMHE